jgi:protein-tyrosine kinase
MATLYGINEHLKPAPVISAGDRRLLGHILIDTGKLQARDVDSVLVAQQNLGVRFGEAAVKLKLVSRADVHQALSSQFDLTGLRPEEGLLSGELVSVYHAFGAPAEAIRRLRTELLLRWFNAEHKLLAVVSAGRGDGRTYLSANLAVALAQLGENTLLIDADMRSPRQHTLFKLDNRIGLASLLGGRADSDAQAIARLPMLPNLSLLPAGPIAPNPLDLLGQPAFTRLLAQVAQRYDVVLIDTPAGNLNADAHLIAARTGGALYVARKGRSKAQEMKKLVASMAATGTTLVGTALNNF